MDKKLDDMANSSNSVFLSYRRSASGDLALAVWQDLYYNNVDAFYDIENIAASQFDQVILNQIVARPYFMPILSPGTLDRCAEPGDWVLREFEQAVSSNRILIPVHTPQFNMADLDSYLPAPLAAAFKKWNFFELPHKYIRLILRDLRERILVPVRLEQIALQETPPADRATVQRNQAAASAAPAVTDMQLSAQERLEQAEFHADSKDWDAVLANLNAAIDQNPALAEAYALRAVANGHKGDLDAVMRDADQAIQLDATQFKAFNARGVVRRARGDLEGAMSDFNEALRLHPKHPEAYNNRAIARAQLGDYAGAVSDNVEFVRLRPYHAQAPLARQNIERWRKMKK